MQDCSFPAYFYTQPMATGPGFYDNLCPQSWQDGSAATFTLQDPHQQVSHLFCPLPRGWCSWQLQMVSGGRLEKGGATLAHVSASMHAPSRAVVCDASSSVAAAMWPPTCGAVCRVRTDAGQPGLDPFCPASPSQTFDCPGN